MWEARQSNFILIAIQINMSRSDANMAASSGSASGVIYSGGSGVRFKMPAANFAPVFQYKNILYLTIIIKFLGKSSFYLENQFCLGPME